MAQSLSARGYNAAVLNPIKRIDQEEDEDIHKEEQEGKSESNTISKLWQGQAIWTKLCPAIAVEPH